MNIMEYVKPELLILIPVINLIGLGLKKSNIKDSFIPLLLGGISTALCGLWVFANAPTNSIAAIFTAIFTAITQGVLIAGASVYFNQLVKQSRKDD